MFKDEHRGKVWDEIRQHDLPAFNRLLSPEVVTAAANRAGVRVGSGPLCIGNLCWLAISAALHRGKSFADLLVITLKILSDQPGWGQSSLGRKCRSSRRSRGRKKHDPRGQSLASVTEEAFVQARQRVPLSFWTWLLLVLAERFEDQHAVGALRCSTKSLSSRRFLASVCEARFR